MMRNIHTRVNATMTDDDGGNYREIAETMTALGFQMNHSSARNQVIYVMMKFVSAYAEMLWGKRLSEAETMTIAKSPMFQAGVIELLQALEHQRRKQARRCRLAIVTDHGEVKPESPTEAHVATSSEKT